jgi:DNA-binding MarR family transcriptional regulator
MSSSIPLNVTRMNSARPDTARPEAARPEAARPHTRDQVDLFVDHWCRENPAIDVAVKSVAIRLQRISHHLDREMRRELAPFDMEPWEFEVLLALLRSPGHQLSAGALLRASQVTSGAISNRLTRLEDRGWVKRGIDVRDRRHVLVTLTPGGEQRAEQLLATKTDSEQRLLSRLDRPTLERMSADLRSLLVSLEGAADGRADRLPPLESPTQPAELRPS